MSRSGAPNYTLEDELKAWSKRGGKPSAYATYPSDSSGGSASSYRKLSRERPPFSSVSFPSRNAADGEDALSPSSSANPQGGSVKEDAASSEVSHSTALVGVQKNSLPNISEDSTGESFGSSRHDSGDNGATAGYHGESHEGSYSNAPASGPPGKWAENLDPTVYVPDKEEDMSDVSEISANPASSRESDVELDATYVEEVMNDSVSSEIPHFSRQEHSLSDPELKWNCPMDDAAYVRLRKSSSTKRDVVGTEGMPERWKYDAPLPGITSVSREDLAHRPLPSSSRSASAPPSSRVYEAQRSLSLYARAKPVKEPMKSRVMSSRPPSTRQTRRSFFRGSLDQSRSRSADIVRPKRSSSLGPGLKSFLSIRRSAGDSSSSLCSSSSQDSASARMRLVKKLFSKPERSNSSEVLPRRSSGNWRRNTGDHTFDSSRGSSSTLNEGSTNVFTRGSRHWIPRRMPNTEERARLCRDSTDDHATAEEIRFASKARESTRSLTKVTDLPWIDFKTKLYGRFSGPVNTQLRPHGDGSLILEGNPFLVFYGTWKNGNLVSPLLNEDEKKEREDAAARAPGKRSISAMSHSRTDLRDSLAGQARRVSDASLISDRVSPNISATNSSFCSLSETRRQPSGSSGSRAKAGRRKRRNPRRYKLGDVCRSPSDMIVHQSNTDAIDSVALLNKMDQAFLKRSSGVWTCAVVAERSLQPKLKGVKNQWFTSDEIKDLPDNVEMEESLLFVIDEDGATKIVKRKRWGRFVRRMANKDASRPPKHGRALEDSSCYQSEC